MNHIVLKIKYLAILFLIVTHCSRENNQSTQENIQNKDSSFAKQDSSSSDTSQIKKQKERPEIKIEFSKDRYFNDVARFLAGKAPADSSSLLYWDSLAFVKAHQAKFDLKFAAKESKQLITLRKWAKDSEGDFYSKNQNVFYPFSGADFLTIHNLYPNAKNYILFGLEPEGLVPDFKKITEEEHDSSLANLSRTIINLMGVSFFITKDMAPDLIRTAYKGILPVMLVFIVRTGHEVLDIQHVRLNKEGKLDIIKPLAIEKQTPWDHDITGIRVVYRKNKTSEPQTVTYFSINASNAGLKKMTKFSTFIDSYGPMSTYIKAASYLMHNEDFSMIRSLILNISDFLVEDDSGIPYKYFTNEHWKISLHGRYTKPITIFKNNFQQDYFDAYKENKDDIKVLNFGIGYVYTLGMSNLMTAEKIKDLE